VKDYKKTKRIPPNKGLWAKVDVQFLRDNYLKLTNAQLAKALHKKITSTRMKLYELGLMREKRSRPWIPSQVEFLKENYRKYGDKELSEIMNRKWPRKELWTKKRVTKKRELLGIKRTAEEVQAIIARNLSQKRFNPVPARTAYMKHARLLTDDYIVAKCLRISKQNREEVKKNHRSLIEFTRKRIASKRAKKEAKQMSYGKSHSAS
jgi:hypothetical protein